MTVTVNTGIVQSDIQTDVGASWTIDELAALATVPSRTIREYQTVGVLMAPRRVGRRGLYNEDHRDRLLLIARLQSRGYSLAGIKDLLDAWDEGASLASVLEHRGMSETALDETPVAFSAAVLAATIPGIDDPLMLTAALNAGLIVRTPDGFAARSSALIHMVADAVNHGAPLDAVLTTIATIRSAARTQAEAVAALFLRELWDPAAPTAATDALARRSRLHLAQAASSLVVDELGAALTRAAAEPNVRGLDQLLDRIRVGSIRVAADQP